MTAIDVNLLTGRYCATSHHDREQPEWPPHAARLFSAMVATWAEAEPPDDGERAALEWLETQTPPRVTASEAVPRRVVSHYVPVNDASVISQTSYRKRAESLKKLTSQWEDQMQASGGEMTKTATRQLTKIRTKIRKARDAARSLTEKAGSTNTQSALDLLPEGRKKKERYFPSVTPEESRITYVWDGDASPEVAGALAGLLERVTRLGHSSSLVSCVLRDDAPDATHIPSGRSAGSALGGTTTTTGGDSATSGNDPGSMRWVRPGQLVALQEAFHRHRAVTPRHLPSVGVGYVEVDLGAADAAAPLRPDTSGEWIVFELSPRDRRLPMTRTVQLAKVLREAILHHASDPLPEGLSGHTADGRPTTAPHVAFLALPNVGYSYSDGRLMGLAVSLPHGLPPQARHASLRSIGKWERSQRGGHDDRWLRLTMGRGGVAHIKRRQAPFALVALRRWVWARRSHRWVSATPVALPAHPGDLRHGSPAARAKAWKRAEDAVVKSCEHVGLPEPENVQVSLSPYLTGGRPAGDFPSFRQGGGPRGGMLRRLLHASVLFAEPVQGPLMLGSGRYLGLGLMRPVHERPPRRGGGGGGAQDSEGGSRE